MTAACAAQGPLDEAVRRLRAGSLVAFATETVWALGADAASAAALDRLRAWKGRDANRALSVLVSGLAAAEALGAHPSPAARRLAAAFWPGPLTMVLPVAQGRFAPRVARSDGAVGFRCSPHPVAGALARRLEAVGAGPVTATSLNRSGHRPARDREEARRECGRAGPVARGACGRGASGPWLLDAGPDAGGEAPSSVVDLTGDAPVILREGPVGAAALAAVLGAEEARA